MSEPRYTLAEAKQALAEEQCLLQGHSYDIESVKTYGDAGTPLGVHCTTCDKRWRVVED